MNYLDWIVVGFLFAGLILGYFKGFLKQLFTVVGLVAGYWLARMFSDDLADWLTENYSAIDGQAALISFTALFVSAYIAVKIIGTFTEKSLDAEAIKSTNNLLGSLLGGVKYILILLIIDIFIVHASLPPENDLADSRFYKMIRKQSVLVLKFVEIPFLNEK